VDEIHPGLALRCTRAQARAAIREAQRIDRLLPRALARLERGEFPAAWFDKLLERTSYDVLQGTEFGAEGVEAPGPRIRLNVTVPVMTRMGQSDAPGMLDGTIPVPAEMARELAAGEETW